MATKEIIKDNLFNRQLGIIDPKELDKHVLIIGAGGIGSWTALALAKTGVKKITIVDFDTVEDVNLAPQFYNMEHNGMNKAAALVERLEDECRLMDQQFYGVDTKWEEWKDREQYFETENVEIVIMAVDSMDVRMKIWSDIKYAGLGLVIDGRMAKEMLSLYAVGPSNEESVAAYEKNLYPSTEADPTPCTERAVAYNQFVIAGLITATVKHYVKKELEYKKILFDLFSMSMITS